MPSTSKAERAYRKAQAALDAVIDKPEGDPIWRDEDFWTRRWPAMVDRRTDALNEYLKER